MGVVTWPVDAPFSSAISVEQSMENATVIKSAPTTTDHNKINKTNRKTHNNTTLMDRNKKNI